MFTVKFYSPVWERGDNYSARKNICEMSQCYDVSENKLSVAAEIQDTTDQSVLLHLKLTDGTPGCVIKLNTIVSTNKNNLF